MLKSTIILNVFLALLPLTRTEFFNSIAVMESLLETQHKLIKHIESSVRYITDLKKALIVRNFLSRCIEEDQLARCDGAHYLGNPINAFTLVLRLTRDLAFVEKILTETTAGLHYEVDETLLYPDKEDVEGIVHGMTRIQLLYDLDVTKMANGTIASAFTNPSFVENVTPMTFCDCYELGLVEYEKDDRSRNIAWIKEALRKFDYRTSCPVKKIHLYDRLSGDYFFMGDYKETVFWTEKRIEADPSDPKSRQLYYSMDHLKQLSVANNIPRYIKPKDRGDYENFPTMCLKPYYSPNASLTCYYAHGPDSFLLLAPMKAERLHHSPLIVMFYDVASDDEILEIKSLSTPKLQTGKSTTKEGLNLCIYQSAWLQTYWSEATARVRRRIAQFSGLPRTTGIEDFEVSNYGTGGYYGPHYDFIRDEDTEMTLATALVYLSDVEEGGATTFTKLGLTVHPVKGAAMFWRNLDQTGDKDYRTLHAVCPILRGSRWAVAVRINL